MVSQQCISSKISQREITSEVVCNKHADWFDFIFRDEAEHRKPKTLAEKSLSSCPCMLKE